MIGDSEATKLVGLFDEPERAERERICRRCRIRQPATGFHRKGGGGRWNICRKCRSATRPPHNESSEAKLRRVLLWKYGITLEQFQALADAQGGVCAMCGCPPQGKQRRLSVDHCHTTGRIRALLCTACNTQLGAFEKIRDRATEYLARYGAGHPLVDHQASATLRGNRTA